MSKKLLYLVAVFASFTLIANAQCETGPEVTLTLTDSYGDTWNNNSLTVNGIDYDQPSTYAGVGFSGVASDSYEVCLDLNSCIDVTYNATGSYATENSWSITDVDGTVLSSGGNESALFGTCLEGCTNPSYAEYSADADIDDGSCLTFSCELDVVTLTLTDTYGDTWTGNTLTINGIDYDQPTQNFLAEASDSYDVCVDLSSCIEVTYNATGFGIYENIWSISDADGALLISGDFNNEVFGDTDACSVGCDDQAAVNYDGTVQVVDNSLCLYPGCMDETAFNYDSLAVADDGTCIPVSLGCIDPIANNITLDANTDDGSCTYTSGCTIEGSVNYNDQAVIDDGSCVTVTCNGISAEVTVNQIVSFSGLFSGLTIINDNGQTSLVNATGDDYDVDLQTNVSVYEVCLSETSSYTATMTAASATASFSITSCDGQLLVASGEADSEYNFSAPDTATVALDFTVVSCDSYIFGCADTSAYNYDESVTSDNGSCVYDGCLDALYTEFNVDATIDDGSCLTLIVDGCMDSEAMNYNMDANTDDASCEYPIVCEDATLTGIQLIMNDSYGDGWNGADLTMSSPGGYMDVVTMPTSGNSDTSVFCLPADCYSIIVSSGSYDYEISWSISTALGSEPALSGVASSTSFLSVGSDADCSIDNFSVGCMDAWASNYDPSATSDDGSCTFPFSNTCAVASDIIFDDTFSGDSDFNMWFTFTAEENQVLVSDVVGGSTFVQWSTSIFSSCDDTESLEGGLSAGTYYVMLDNDATINLSYEVTFSLEDGVVGCFDQYANNYDPSANIEGECDYACENISTILTIVTPSFSPDQIAFDFLAADGQVVAQGGYDGEFVYDSSYEINLCLLPGEYTMNAYEDSGSGWGTSNAGSTGSSGYSFSYSCGEGDNISNITPANNGGAAPNNGTFGLFGEYELESSETFTVYDCNDIVYGCTDETADNYNMEANVEDGGCEFLGCTDFNYVEYDPSANTDDGSCLTSICPEGSAAVMISAGGGSYDSEVSWSLASCEGTQMVGGLAGELLYCTSEAAFQINMIDSYGDGWNGATITINGQVFGEDFTAGAEASALFGDCGLPGCIDPLALNFDGNASVDDGSCEYCPEPTSLVSVSCGGGAWTGEVSWVVFTCEGDTILNGGAPYEESSCLELPDGYTVQMIDSYGDGWNGNVLTINGMDYELLSGASEEVIVGDCGFVYGCTDSTAVNYNVDANVDDGECEYLCGEGESPVSIIMIDSYGDGWNGNTLVLNNTDDSTSTSFTLETGSLGYADACMNLDECYSIVVGGGSFASEVEWAVTGVDGSVVADGFAPEIAVAGFCVIPGCTDETALNYNEDANVDDESCIAIVEGCMNNSYEEYNMDATVDDGTCATFLCVGDVVTLTLTDSYGDTWNGNTLTIDTIVYDQPSTGSLGVGGSDSYDVCLDLSVCTDVIYTLETGFTYPTENSWTITSAEGDTLASGDYFANEGNGYVGSGCPVLGCMDVSADNYDMDATIDDGSCDYSGCTDFNAANYNPDATIDDDSCIYPCPEGTSKVDMLITTDDYASENEYSLVDAQDGYIWSSGLLANQNNTTVFNTVCVDNGSELTFTLTDSYGDGIVNGGFEIYVCGESVFQDFNFSPSADGDAYETSYDFYVACGAVYGCTDSDALNYDPLADEDDGSCIFPCLGFEATLSVTGAAFAGEMSWTLTDADGNIMESAPQGTYTTGETIDYELCLDEGSDYTINMFDSYGDGWNGGYLSLDAECQITDSAEYTVAVNSYEGSVPFTASCGSVGCNAPFDWDVTITGSNHTVMVPETATIMMDDMDMTEGFVGVFFENSDGEMQCAGYTEITGETVQIAAMGDDTTTDEVDGLTSGTEFTWMMFDCTTGDVMAATATYAAGPNTYTTNGLTFVSSITSVPAGPECQMLDFPSGWSMFSTYMIADDMDMASILAPIIDNVIIAKDNAGNAYLVEYAFNGVGDLSVGQGYQIKTDAEVSIEICGSYAFPEDNAIDISAGWNMIGYLRTEPAAADAVMADINDAGNLIIAKDYSGNAYLPEYSFNGIGDMNPGEGYQMKTIDTDMLQYLSNDDSYRLSSIETTVNNVSHFNKVVSTDNNMTVVIEDTAWDIVPTEGSEIAAFDKEGKLIGSAIYTSPVTVLTVWGDDAMTASKEAARVSENVSFQVWTAGVLTHFTVSDWTEGSSSYAVDAINIASTIETSSSTSIATSLRELVKVVNVLGQEVNMDDEDFKGEVLFQIYSDGTVEKIVR